VIRDAIYDLVARNPVSESIDVLALRLRAGLVPAGKPVGDEDPVLHLDSLESPSNDQGSAEDRYR
jgi:hypothetical protein